MDLDYCRIQDERDRKLLAVHSSSGSTGTGTADVLDTLNNTTRGAHEIPSQRRWHIEIPDEGNYHCEALTSSKSLTVVYLAGSYIGLRRSGGSGTSLCLMAI